MENKRSYKDFMDTIEFLREGESFVTDSEKKILDSLDEIIKIDRYNAITYELFQREENFIKLLNVINKRIIQINSLIEKGCSDYEYLIKKDKLIELRNNIIEYKNNKLENIDNHINELIFQCLPALSLNYSSQTPVFGKNLVDKECVNTYGIKYSINCDVVDRLFEVFDNDLSVDEISNGVDYIEEEKRIKSVIKAYEEAINSKDEIYKNKDLIIRYNIINKRLNKLKTKINPKTYMNELFSIDFKLSNYSNINDFFFKHEKISELKNRKKIIKEEESRISSYQDEYNDLKEELDDIEKIFKYSGIDKILENYDKSISYDDSLSYNMTLFYNKNDIDNYYRFIDKNINKEKDNLVIIQNKKNDYLDRISDDNRDLLINNYDTARLIKRFTIGPMTDDICPAISLFILKVLSVIKKSEYEDKGLTKDEVRKVVSSFKKDIVDNYGLFLERYKSIMSSDTKVDIYHN